MKIYQIHSISGDYEDYSDVIVASYLSNEKAEVHKEELEAEESIRRKCSNCPLFFYDEECDFDNAKYIEKTKKYCEFLDPYIDELDNVTCKNRSWNLWEYNYRIKEEEVIE